MVEGKPFVILGGELLNSSGSTASDMQKHWDELADLNLNTVLLAVAWEQIEKSEGVFDFSEIGKIISQARERKMKLVLLWFGSWKNGFSGYVPHWAMRDIKRFPRVKNKDGQNRPCLSPFSKSVLEADKKAFVKLMEFVAEADPSGEVVIMAQVENEIGLLDDSRDRSETAEKLFSEKVLSFFIFKASLAAKYIFVVPSGATVVVVIDVPTPKVPPVKFAPTYLVFAI